MALSRAEAFCDKGWLRPHSKVATGQDSCKGGSEGFCLVLAAAGSGRSSPGGWRGLNCRMASALIRNVGKKLVPFSKGLFCLLSFLLVLVLCMRRGFHNYLLVHLHGDCHLGSHLSDAFMGGPTSPPQAKCFPWRGGPSSLPVPLSFCDVSQEVTGCSACRFQARERGSAAESPYSCLMIWDALFHLCRGPWCLTCCWLPLQL